MKDDFSDFLDGNERVPRPIYERVLQYLEIKLNPKTVLLKFYISNILGAFFTLLFCPQYGFGPYGGEFGIFHYIMGSGPVWCGIFCASVFMAFGNLFSLIVLKGYEVEWIKRNSRMVLLPWVSFLFFFGMIAKAYAPGSLHHNTLSFHLSWFGTAILVSFIMVRGLGKIKIF